MTTTRKRPPGLDILGGRLWEVLRIIFFASVNLYQGILIFCVVHFSFSSLFYTILPYSPISAQFYPSLNLNFGTILLSSPVNSGAYDFQYCGLKVVLNKK